MNPIKLFLFVFFILTRYFRENTYFLGLTIDIFWATDRRFWHAFSGLQYAFFGFTKRIFWVNNTHLLSSQYAYSSTLTTYRSSHHELLVLLSMSKQRWQQCNFCLWKKPSFMLACTPQSIWKIFWYGFTFHRMTLRSIQLYFDVNSSEWQKGHWIQCVQYEWSESK